MSRRAWRPGSFTYLASYVVLVALFGCLFSWYREDFYHVTASMEPAFVRMRSSLRDELAASLVDTTNSLRVPFGTDSATVPGWFAVSELRASNDGKLHFNATVMVSFVRQSTRFMQNASFDVEISELAVTPKRFYQSIGVDERNVSYSLPLVVHQTSGPALPVGTLERLARCRFGGVEGMPCVSESLVRRLEAFRLASFGWPAELGFASALPRMLYLSVVTMNTLGYGDILPVTGRARLLTGLESFLGIVLLGAFVSSLVSRAAGRSKESDE